MNYNCPICGAELVESLGNSIHAGDAKYGMNLFCNNPKCPAQEVAGHGDNVKEAWTVIQAKFVTRTERE
jgi:hypothetical protein